MLPFLWTAIFLQLPASKSSPIDEKSPKLITLSSQTFLKENTKQKLMRKKTRRI
jgi:hypothetical protein